jgi:hypothetical protein
MAATKKQKREQKERERKDRVDRIADEIRRDVRDDAETYLKDSEVREGGE